MKKLHISCLAKIDMALKTFFYSSFNIHKTKIAGSCIPSEHWHIVLTHCWRVKSVMTTVIKSQTIRMRKYPIIDEILRWFACIYIHYRQKGWNIWKVQWNHSYLIFWFAGNGMAPMTNMYCNFNATLVCGVMEEKCNMQCPKLKRHNRVLRNVSFFFILRLKFSLTSRISIITLWMYVNFVWA